MKIKSFALKIAFSLFLAHSVFAFSAEDIISPQQGTWENVQPLVLNVNEGEEVYYSLTQSDPLVSGFAYDRPVVIDGSGDITVSIAVLSSEGRRSDFSVSYTVKKGLPYSTDSDTSEFLSEISVNPLVKYACGKDFTVPQTLAFSMEKNVRPYLQGCTISVSRENTFEYFVPCTVSLLNNDPLRMWRFVLQVTPSLENENASPKNKEKPFKIENWTDFTFTQDGLIYQIDDEYWTGEKKSIVLDRSVPHTIRWQSVAFEEGNPVEQWTLPPKPELVKEKLSDGTYVFKSSVENYKLTLDGKNFYTSLKADTFSGKDFYCSFTGSFYIDGIKEGSFSESFRIDKAPPPPPFISSSEKSSFARNEVRINILSSPDSRVFYSLAEPIEDENGFEETSIHFFDKIESGDFVPYYGENIVLKSRSQKATFYKLFAYALDGSGNKSAVSQYQVIVDEYNYYLSSTGLIQSAQRIPDGSYSNPFTTFDQALEAINSMKYTRLHVSGKIDVSPGTKTIYSDCIFICNESRFVLGEDTFINISGASVEVHNSIFEKNDSSRKVKNLFKVENGKLTLVDCETVGIFTGDGILIDGKNADFNFKNTGLTVQGDSYTCGVSGLSVNCQFSDCRITSVAANCVGVSLNKGNARSENSKFTIIGTLGRCLEFSGCNVSLMNNSFKLNISANSSASSYLWHDANTVILENSESKVDS